MFRFGCSIGVWFTIYLWATDIVDDVGLGVKVNMCVCVCVRGIPRGLQVVLSSGGGMGAGPN